MLSLMAINDIESCQSLVQPNEYNDINECFYFTIQSHRQLLSLTDRYNDIEYFYASRLPGEAAPVADRHMHPAEPRTLRLTLRKAF